MVGGIGPEEEAGAVRFWLDRAAGWWSALMLIALCVGSGRLIASLPIFDGCRLSHDRLVNVLVYGTLGSFGAYSVLVMLGLANVLGSFGVYGFVVLLGLAGVHGLRLMFRDASVESRDASHALANRSPWSHPWAGRLAWTLIVLWSLPYIVQTMLPDSDWDGAAYHLPMAERYLSLGIWATDPLMPHYNFNGAVNLFYSVFMKLGIMSACIPLNFVMTACLPLAVFAFGRHLWSNSVGLWSALICLATNILWELAVDSRIDSILSFYATVACFAFLLWRKDESPRGWLVVAAMALGMAIGTKITALVLLVPLGLGALVCSFGRMRRKVPVGASLLMVAAIVVSCPSGVWFVRNVLDLGDPVYPFMGQLVYKDGTGETVPFRPAFEELVANTMGPEKLSRLRGFQTFGVEVNDAPKPAQERSRFGVWASITQSFVSDPPPPEGAPHARKPFHWICPLLILSLALPFVRSGRSAMWLYGTVWFSAMVLGSRSHLLRYLILIMPLMATCVGVMLSRLKRTPIIALLVSLVASQALWCSAAEWGKLRATNPGPLLLGKESRLSWLEGVGYNGVQNVVSMSRDINTRIADGRMSADARVFMLGESKGLEFECDYLPDTSRDGFRWLVEIIRANGDVASLAASFSERGITHILVDGSLYHWALTNTNVARDQLAYTLNFLFRFLLEYGEEPWSQHGQTIYPLKIGVPSVSSDGG